MKGGNEALHPYIHLSSDCSKNDRPFFFYDLGPFKGRRRILHSMPYVKKIHFSSCCCNNKGSSTLVPPFLHSSNKRQEKGEGLKHLHKMHAFKNPHSTPFLYLGSSCCITDLGLKLHKKYKIIQRIIWHILTGFGWTLRVLRGWDANWRTFLKGFHIFCNVKSFVKMQRNYYLLVIKTGPLK